MSDPMEAVKSWVQEQGAIEAYWFSEGLDFDWPLEMTFCHVASGDLYRDIILHDKQQGTRKTLHNQIDPAVWSMLHDALANSAFWDNAEWENVSGEAPDLIFMGFRNGNFRLREVWSRDPGVPAYHLEAFFSEQIRSAFAGRRQ